MWTEPSTGSNFQRPFSPVQLISNVPTQPLVILFKKKKKIQFVIQSLVAQTVKNLPAMQETRVQFLGRKDPLEKEMATHSSILVWEIPWAEKHGGLQSNRVTHN